jgi:hypothetical protein
MVKGGLAQKSDFTKLESSLDVAIGMGDVSYICPMPSEPPNKSAE